MQVVIDIPEEKYRHIQEEQWLPNRLLIEKAIANGTPLPKGHGDLIDRDTLDAEAKAYTYDAPIVVPKRG